MEIPAFFYGLPADVKRRCRRAVTAVKRGTPLSEIVGDDTVDTRGTKGLIVLDGPGPSVGGLQQFCMYPLSREMSTKLDASLRTRTNHDLLATAWGVLAMQGQALQVWLGANGKPTGHDRRRAFLRACLREWDAFELEGVRYSSGSNTPTTVWGASRCVYFALANEGASADLIQEYGSDRFKFGDDIPSHEGGLRRLIERAGLTRSLESDPA